MVKSVCIAICGILSMGVMAQVKKQFSVDTPASECDLVELSIRAKAGNCFIKSSQNAELLNVYSNQEPENYSHTLTNKIVSKTCKIDLAMKQGAKRGVGDKITYSMLSSSNELEKSSEKFWKIYLTENKPYSLDLLYGLGNANIDLSGLSISKLKIRTGSADVNVGYSDIGNKVTMDTFLVKVEMGSLAVNQLSKSNSKNIVAEVGFGNLLLDFSDKSRIRNRVTGSVGAGNLTILMPSKEVPVLVRISESWLCSINLCKSLKKVDENTFANEAYTKNPKNPMYFDLDVSMGKIIFKE